MELHPELFQRQAELLAMEADGADKRRLWAVILGAKLFRDGNQWCALYGENIQDGVCGFGPTPAAALNAFEHAMYAERPPAPTTPEETP